MSQINSNNISTTQTITNNVIVNTSVPTAPIPSIPTVPSIPSIPTIHSIPAIPKIPAIPSIPAVIPKKIHEIKKEDHDPKADVKIENKPTESRGFKYLFIVGALLDEIKSENPMSRLKKVPIVEVSIINLKIESVLASKNSKPAAANPVN